MNTPWWKFLFFSLLLAYCWVYAPYGINETDGGFLTGLAWQVLNGQMLYRDVVYVRPPLPVWLHAGFLQLVPEHGAVLAERWFFYVKVALYSWLAAALLATGSRRWILACLGFVVSVHSYPPMAWHTVDGILFAVLALWFFWRRAPAWSPVWGGVALAMALLCKQSFYPLAFLWTMLLWLEPNARRAGWGLAGFALAGIAFAGWLGWNNLWGAFFRLTGGAAGGGQALQHGLLDYFQISPIMLVITGLLLVPSIGWGWRAQYPRRVFWLWALWLLAMGASYVWTLWQRQEPTLPFTQVRILFWLGLAMVFFPEGPTGNDHRYLRGADLRLFALLAISWCASVSWGYSLPILLSTPWIFAAMLLSERLWRRGFSSLPPVWAPLAVLAGLLATFRLGYDFIYRDGRRGDMHQPMGEVFPVLQGIYSDDETRALYQDLQQLAIRYGPAIKTLPAFPQANFLTRTPPPLPLDWVVARETNGDFIQTGRELQKNRPVLLLEKKYAATLDTDPELAFSRVIRQKARFLEETPHFWVLRY